MWGVHDGPRGAIRRPAGASASAAHRYPIRLDRAIGGGELPNARLQRAFADPAQPNALDRFLSMVHWAWFFVPHVTLVYILLRDDHLEPSKRRFPRAARQMAATYDLGCAGYFAVPTAPPWWAVENGYADERVRRLMVDVGERVWGGPGRGSTTRSGKPVGGDAIASLRQLSYGRVAPARDRARWPAASDGRTR